MSHQIKGRTVIDLDPNTSSKFHLCPDVLLEVDQGLVRNKSKAWTALDSRQLAFGRAANQLAWKGDTLRENWGTN